MLEKRAVRSTATRFPLIYQQFVTNYFEEIRKAAPAPPPALTNP